MRGGSRSWRRPSTPATLLRRPEGKRKKRRRRGTRRDTLVHCGFFFVRLSWTGSGLQANMIEEYVLLCLFALLLLFPFVPVMLVATQAILSLLLRDMTCMVPTVMSFTVPLNGSIIVATATVVTSCSSSAACSGSAAPMCCGGVCVAISCGGGGFTPDGAYDSVWDSVRAAYWNISSIISSTIGRWVCLHTEWLVQQQR